MTEEERRMRQAQKIGEMPKSPLADVKPGEDIDPIDTQLRITLRNVEAFRTGLPGPIDKLIEKLAHERAALQQLCKDVYESIWTGTEYTFRHRLQSAANAEDISEQA